MNTTTARLLPGATNVAIQDTKDNQTTIVYNAPPWGDKRQCIHKLPGTWKIKTISKHLVTLVNNDIIIKEDEPCTQPI